VAIVVIMLMQRTSSYTAFRAKFDKVTEEMEYYGLPPELQSRIKTYYEYLFIHQTRMGSHSIYLDKELSNNLRSEIALILHRDFIKKVPLFKNCTTDCLIAVIIALKSAIYLPDDWVVRKGEVGKHLYIIRVGVVAVLEEEEEKNEAGKVEMSYHLVATLEEGSFFGELALLLDRKRTVSVKAIGFCEMSTLSKDNFARIMLDFPDLLESTRLIADERREKLEDFRQDKGKKKVGLKWPTSKEILSLAKAQKPDSPTHQQHGNTLPPLMSTQRKDVLPKLESSENILKKLAEERGFAPGQKSLVGRSSTLSAFENVNLRSKSEDEADNLMRGDSSSDAWKGEMNKLNLKLERTSCEVAALNKKVDSIVDSLHLLLRKQAGVDTGV
jgi:hypothetical protein